jgi:hypothetical protein
MAPLARKPAAMLLAQPPWSPKKAFSSKSDATMPVVVQNRAELEPVLA